MPSNPLTPSDVLRYIERHKSEFGFAPSALDLAQDDYDAMLAYITRFQRYAERPSGTMSSVGRLTVMGTEIRKDAPAVTTQAATCCAPITVESYGVATFQVKGGLYSVNEIEFILAAANRASARMDSAMKATLANICGGWNHG